MKQLLLTALFCLSVCYGTFAAIFDGAGTTEDPYLINDQKDLARLAVLVNGGYIGGYSDASYRLTADIDLADFGAPETTGWIPIGSDGASFYGQFDGDNHTIYNLTIKRTDIDYAGLFGRASDAEFKNIKLVGGEIQIDVDRYSDVGFLAGGMTSGNMDNCSSTGTITVTSSSLSSLSTVGGLVGRVHFNSSVRNCYTTGTVTVTSTSDHSFYVGGLVGFLDAGPVSNCYTTGDVTVTCNFSSCVGGLVGYTRFSVSDCYTTGNVTAISGSPSVGGLVGSSDFSSISDCYATGDVTATSESSSAGGLVGSSSSTIGNSYATGDVTATCNFSYAGGLVGATSFATIRNSYASGAVTATSESKSYAGGLVGYTYYRYPLPTITYLLTISSCYATGVVIATSESESFAGGLVGYTNGGITNSVAANNFVTGESPDDEVCAGGVVGYADEPADITDCYHKETMVVAGTGHDNTVSGQSATASELTSRAFYANLGWDMDEVWSIEEGVDLPKLRVKPGDSSAINTPDASQENNIRVYSNGNSIVVAGANTGEAVWVYNLSGQLMQQTTITSPETRIAIPQGIYIVKVGSAARVRKN